MIVRSREADRLVEPWSLALSLLEASSGSRPLGGYLSMAHLSGISQLTPTANTRAAGLQKRRRSAGGRALAGRLSTKIDTMIDAPGNPLGFFLSGGDALDPVAADHRRPDM
jgi:hypothetical protein